MFNVFLSDWGTAGHQLSTLCSPLFLHSNHETVVYMLSVEIVLTFLSENLQTCTKLHYIKKKHIIIIKYIVPLLTWQLLEFFWIGSSTGTSMMEGNCFYSFSHYTTPILCNFLVIFLRQVILWEGSLKIEISQMFFSLD